MKKVLVAFLMVVSGVCGAAYEKFTIVSAPLKVFHSGDVLTAEDLNMNFAALRHEIEALKKSH